MVKGFVGVNIADLIWIFNFDEKGGWSKKKNFPYNLNEQVVFLALSSDGHILVVGSLSYKLIYSVRWIQIFGRGGLIDHKWSLMGAPFAAVPREPIVSSANGSVLATGWSGDANNHGEIWVFEYE